MGQTGQSNLVVFGWLHRRKVFTGNAHVTFLIIQVNSTGSAHHIPDKTFLGNELRILEQVQNYSWFNQSSVIVDTRINKAIYSYFN